MSAQPAKPAFYIRKTDALYAGIGCGKIPRDYQVKALDLSRGKNSFYFAMEMRLGKTPTALWWMAERNITSAFIFAPKVVLISWEKELKEWGWPYHDLSGMTNNARSTHISSNRNGIRLLNYEALLNDSVERCLDNADNRPQCFILDEATEIKNARSKRTKAFLRLCDAVSYKLCLSGLPTPEDWSDIWAQMAFLNDGRWMGASNFWKWLRDNSTEDPLGYGHFFNPRQALAIKDAFKTQSYSLSRKAAGIGETKIYQTRSEALSPRLQAIYKTIVKTWEIPGLDKDKDFTSAKYAFVVTTWLQRLCGGFLPGFYEEIWKYKELAKILLEDLPRNDSAVVWFAFNDEIKKAYEHPTFKNIRSKIGTLMGEDSQDKRRTILLRFRKGDIKHLFIQRKLGKFGLDLSKADTAINFSYPRALLDWSQSEDRIIMPGKNNPLLYINLVTRNTIEEGIIDDLTNKKTDAKCFLADPRAMVKH